MSALVDHHRTLARPPAERLFCRADGVCAVRPEMAADEQAHFAEHFAESFAVALNEALAPHTGPAHPKASKP